MELAVSDSAALAVICNQKLLTADDTDLIELTRDDRRV